MIQYNQRLPGDPEVRKETAAMKWMIASDLHGSAYGCRRLLAAYEAEQAERLLLLGDLLYHGPRNDLPREYAPKQVIAMLNERKQELVCVRGNCDCEVDQMVLEFPILSDYCILTEQKTVVIATHGHLPSERLPLRPGEILLQGHTHVPGKFEQGSRIVLNPGSVSLPKENSWQGYMTWENGCFLWKNLDGEEMLRYLCRT